MYSFAEFKGLVDFLRFLAFLLVPRAKGAVT
jgi:hypothetical protein